MMLEMCRCRPVGVTACRCAAILKIGAAVGFAAEALSREESRFGSAREEAT